MERLCSSNILSKASELNQNEIYVATLPIDVKDPSDFVDYAGGGSDAMARFEVEVLDTAQAWDEWYIDRILSRYDTDAKDGMDGCFSRICDEVSSFVSTFSNPADRTRRAYKISEQLVGLIVRDSDKNSSSVGMMRVQFESDILNMSSRKAGVREAMERRIEQTDGFAGDTAIEKMNKLTGGEGVSSDTEEDDRKMSKSALARVAPPDINNAQRTNSPPKVRRPISQARYQNDQDADRKTRRLVNHREQQHIVPHFSGFTFKHQSDRDWLGISDVSS